ncbi:MAG TPA: extracellular solute-binding protein [Spirochaetales bacterium]|nr:extracellular solute-binding protein [Spirochaetales bacterium]HRY54437.1 extracellular solute-binding protein [Spirochaetia bacterium]HRZ63741.1 extracellular solute-binding protein [Spirochaetia bacterium]
MKSRLRGAALFAACAIALCIGGCARKSGEAAAQKKLYIFNWTYYTPDSVIEKFKKEYGVELVYDSFASNEEMFAKLKAGGSDYDIVFPSADYVSIMIKEGMLAEIDKSKLMNLKNVDPAVLARAEEYDPGMKYALPYYMGAAGVAVNKTKVKGYEPSWSIFRRKDLAGKMTMLDDMREVMGDALAALGKSVNSVDAGDLAAAGKLVNESWKPNLLKFDAEAFAKGFAAGEFWVAQGYAESIFAEYEEARRSEVDFFIPKEGGPLYIDSMVILKGSKNKELALKFMDFIHRPEIYAEFCDAFGFPATCNVPARPLKKGPQWYKAEDLAPCELKKDLGADLEKYNAIWQEIRVGK